ncbi:MAG: hypothetical protein QM504_04480 [Pseudomonadota bacterium]
MSSCCSDKNDVSHSHRKQPCPECHNFSYAVKVRTLLHQIKYPDNLNIDNENYYFCSSVSCMVGYFSLSGNIIHKNQLRNHQQILNKKICFCFDINEETYTKAKNPEEIKSFVKNQTKLGLCACDIRNPSGQCCLTHFKVLDSN